MDTSMTAPEPKSDFKLTTDTPYLALTSELWGVYCDDLGENYNGIIALHMKSYHLKQWGSSSQMHLYESLSLFYW